MKLHRAGKRADWDKLKKRQRNFWQRLAVSTHGILTPGNIISLTGFALVIYGLVMVYRGTIPAGLLAITVGRIFDIADGVLADKTGTKSPLGETVDATIDKIEIVAALPVLVFATILMPWQAIIIFMQHAANVVFTGIAKLQGLTPHASRSGKYATTTQWLAIVLYGIARLSDRLDSVETVASAVFAVSVVVGLVAAWKYAEKATENLV